MSILSSTRKISSTNEGQSTKGDGVGSTASNNTTKGLKKQKDYGNRSIASNHFTEFDDAEGKKKCKCNYCGKEYSCGSKSCGTSTLLSHMKSCASNPANQTSNQSQLAFNTSKVDEATGEAEINLVAWKFDQQVARKAIAEMIIMDELPFKLVENEGFKRCMRICQPSLVIPSRSIVTRDCYQLFLDEKLKLKAQLKNSALRVCLTTDTWTFVQRINYMCLTAHFIDSNWKLQKKVINFCPISSHKGSDIGRCVELCLIDWGLQNIFTVTVDNASSNDTAIDYLKSKFVKWGNFCVLKAKWTHVRCMAHVLNLVAQDGIKDLGGSVESVRAAVRYVRQSPARLRKFMEYAKLEKIDCQKSLCLDVPTRWNSTYLMLSVAIMYEGVFDRLAMEDVVYRSDLEEQHGSKPGPGVPHCWDWSNVRRLVGFLQLFYQLTLRVSGTRYITSNNYLDSISCIQSVLKECFSSNDDDLREMASRMKKKFDKYWGDIDKFNLLVFIASIFDPRTKLIYLEVTLCNMYGDDDGGKIAELCKSALYELFNDYKRIHSDQHLRSVASSSPVMSQTSSSVSQNSVDVLFGNNNDAIRALREKNLAEMKRRKAGSGIANDTKSELDRYLTEEIEENAEYFNSQDFTVLEWWKRRSPAFPILSLVARDILAIPISTVASESAFSTGGRVLDLFRSSLTPKTVQALICCQDWIRSCDVPVNVEEHIEDLEKFEEDIRQSMNESTIVDV